MLYENEKRILQEAHLMLERYNLAAYTSGNVSLRVDQHVIIKPSGIPYSKLMYEDMVVVGLNGEVVEGNKAPSVDTATHLHLFNHLDWARSIIHTHSTFATVWAIMEKPIPVLCTAHADVFGEEIPIAEYAPVGSEAIGKSALKALRKSGTVLLSKHGVLIIGTSVDDSLKKAIFLEEVARVSYFSSAWGNPTSLSNSEVQRLFDQYKSKYGQR
ncbi:MAG TPA: L-ribulose-5-phosphate 4-epimerase [Kosmotogaceae bacterium]|nr:MAG: L-ribulose 5-phosphate 4-epimerase [Thermotogales bacterium 46_20]HAA85614.1 L-ribulose-5-phosphate 4-epimerase [Kosmotogaceae bacterium]